MITIYTKPPEMGYCQQCVATKRKAINLDIPFVEKDLYAPENAEVLERAKARGISSAPVVVLDDEHATGLSWWGGYRPDLLLGLTEPSA